MQAGCSIKQMPLQCMWVGEKDFAHFFFLFFFLRERERERERVQPSEGQRER